MAFMKTALQMKVEAPPRKEARKSLKSKRRKAKEFCQSARRHRMSINKASRCASREVLAY